MAGYGNRLMLATQGYTTIIPAQDFISDVTYQDFMMYRCVNESKFLKALSNVKIDDSTTLADKVKTPEDVRKLSAYADNGQDILKWNVSIKDLLGSIEFNSKEKSNVKCQIGFSND